MAQIHALTPEGRLPTAAVQHVREIVTDTTWEVAIPLTADWHPGVSSQVTAYRTGNVVTVAAWRLSVNSGVTGDVIAYSLPPGYRMPPVTNLYGMEDSRGAALSVVSNTVRIVAPSTSVSHHSFTFITLDPPPAQ